MHTGYIDSMNTLQIILTWTGIGIVTGVGFVAVVIAAVKLGELFEKLFPKRAQPEADFLEEKMCKMGRDYIVFSYDMRLVSDALGEKLKNLRKELWAKDYVLPVISIATANFPAGKNCVIRIEGKEIFNGEINPKDTDDTKVDSIISTIRLYFYSKSSWKLANALTPTEKELWKEIKERKND